MSLPTSPFCSSLLIWSISELNSTCDCLFSYFIIIKIDLGSRVVAEYIICSGPEFVTSIGVGLTTGKKKWRFYTPEQFILLFIYICTYIFKLTFLELTLPQSERNHAFKWNRLQKRTNNCNKSERTCSDDLNETATPLQQKSSREIS